MELRSFSPTCKPRFSCQNSGLTDPCSERTDLFYKTALLTVQRQRELEPLLCLYWTCRELEALVHSIITMLTTNVTYSEMLALMPGLPASQMQTESDNIRDPVGIYPRDSDVRSQTLLYDAHRTLFKTLHHDGKLSDPSDEAQIVKYTQAHLENLKNWRSFLPDNLNWRDGDPPSTDMDLARLRAAYYDSKCRALMPCAMLAMDEFQLATLRRENSIQATVSQRALDYMEAAIEYLIAFDRVGAASESPYKIGDTHNLERPVVSNLLNTLHALVHSMALKIYVH